MSVFKRFEKTDVVRSTLVASPKLEFVSGTNGWRGNQLVSSSISLLDGPRGVFNQNPAITIRPVFRRSMFNVDGGPLDVTGSYPATASLKYVVVRPEEAAGDRYNLYRKHWAVVQRTYELSSRYNVEYHTGSYDYYALFFKSGSSNIAACSGSVGANTWNTMSSSFTIECLIKPFAVTSWNTDFTIASRNGHFVFGITGSTGQLFFSGSFLGLFTSSFGPDVNRWSHVTVRGADGTGSFLIDRVDAGSFTFTGSMATTSPALPSPTLGNVFSSPTANGGAVESGSAGNAVGHTNRSFHGLMHEAKFWSVRRTDEQLSASYNSVLYSSASVGGLVAYYRLNQGPLFRSDIDPALYKIGSGVLDHSPNGHHLTLGGFSRKGPVWHPNDNNRFYAPKQLAVQSSSLPMLRMFNVPSIMYGTQIATGSVEIVCRTYSGPDVSMVRVLKDDGRGGLYISGSVCSSSLENKESYKGVEWNKVGNVFYGEGLIVIKDPALFDLGFNDTTTAHPTDILSVSFRGENRIPTVSLMCRANAGEFNASNNETWSEYDPDIGKHVIKDVEQKTYITAVGLYDENYKLVGVAKLASPIRKKLNHQLNIRLRMDF